MLHRKTINFNRYSTIFSNYLSILFFVQPSMTCCLALATAKTSSGTSFVMVEPAAM